MVKALYEYVHESDMRDDVNKCVDPTGEFARVEVGCLIGGSIKRADNVFRYDGTLYANECKIDWNDHQHAIGQAKCNADTLTRHSGQRHAPSVAYNGFPPNDVIVLHRREGVRVFVIREGVLHDVTGVQTVAPQVTCDELRASCISWCGFNVEYLFGDNKALTPPRLVNHMYDVGVPQVDWRDPRLAVVDVVAGTGTFLVEAIARKFDAQVKLCSDERLRIKNVIKQVRYNDTRFDMASVFIKWIVSRWGHLGVTERDVKPIVLCKDALTLTREELVGYDRDGLMSLLIIGNPPYNGVSYDDVPEKFRPFCPTGKQFRSHYPFIGLERELLKDGERLIFVTPHKWLTEGAGLGLRRELDKDGKLAHLEVMPQPPEWTQVQTGQVAVFVFEKDRKEHASSVFCTPDGRFPNVNTNETRDLLQKVLSFHPSLPRIEFFRGPGNFKLIEGAPNRDYMERYNKRCNGPVVVSPEHEERITKAKLNGQQFLLYPDMNRAPFKILGKDPERVKVFIETVSPQPVHDTYVVTATQAPEKMLRLLDHPVSRLVWRSFFDTRHFAPALTDLLPDVTSLLPDEPTEEDINNVFCLTLKEIQLVTELASAYGTDM